MHDSSDRDLRDQFRRLKDADVAAAPPIGPLLDRARARRVPRRPPRLALAAGALALVAVVTYSVAHPGRGSEISAPALALPTDFLLDTPGRDLLASVPGLTTVASTQRSLP